MNRITTCPVPQEALLTRFNNIPGAYTDAFTVTMPGPVPFPDFITAFYTTSLFRAEIAVLRLTLRGRGVNWDAVTLAKGEIDQFAAWSVEDRTDDQLLMVDLHHTTRSWFHLTSTGTDTALWFGSGIVPREEHNRLPQPYRAAIGFHRTYSRALLWSARRRLSHRS